MTRPPPLIALRAASFRQTPSSHPIFPTTTFTLPSPHPPRNHKWAILGSSKSKFLSILRGSYLAYPPNSRLYPAFGAHNKWPQSAIQMVSFGGDSSSSTGMLKGSIGGDGYTSARYETLREEFDLSLREWLGSGDVYEVARDLRLGDLLDQAVMTLSNGQSRRARIAQALLKKPEVLMVDEPFMGLDPPSKKIISALLDQISTPSLRGGDWMTTPVLLGLREQDVVPQWITHIAYVANEKLIASGTKNEVVNGVRQIGRELHLEGQEQQEPVGGVVEKAWAGIGSREKTTPMKEVKSLAEPLVEMENIRIAYFGNIVLDDFTWTIRRGEKWGLFGPNGSGKTTITSLLTSDHPLTYSLPIKHFSRPRLPVPGQPGISVFDIQARIGISSPELHSYFPRHLSLRKCVESGFAETFVTAPSISPEQRTHLESVLADFTDLVPDWTQPFGEVDLSTQRLALFLRATAPKRDLVIYDEAFSGMKDVVRGRCFEFLKTEKGWEEGRQAMVVVSHVSEEVPEGITHWVKLGEKGGKEKAVFGDF